LFHHAKYHADTPARLASLAASLQTQLVSIFTLAASFESSKWPKHHKKVNDVLDIWSRHGYLSKEHHDELRKAVKFAGATNSGTNNLLDAQKEVPYLMPATHGNPNTPWYDLPAANMLPHIIPNSNVPINPALMRPLQFVAGPAKESLVNVVKDFLKDVEAMYDKSRTVKDDGRIVDLDPMGQPLVRDEITGDLVPLETYYGWSIAFCTKMKKRKRGELVEDDRNIRGRSRSPVNDNQASNRRRYSSSRSRSPSRTRHQGFRDRSYSRSPNRSRSPYRRSSPPGLPNRPKLTMPPLNRHLSNLTNSFTRPPLATPIDQIDNPMTTIQPPPPVQSSANHYQHNFPLDPSGLPIPPPPPFHTGPWPPPPPPMPSGMNYNSGQYPNFSTMNFVPPPPPALPTPGYVGQTLGLGGARMNQMPGAQAGIWQNPPQPPPQMGYVAAMLQGQGQGQQGQGYGGGPGRGDRGQGQGYRGQGQGRGGQGRGRGGWRGGGGDSRRY